MAEISAATAAVNVISEKTPHPFTPAKRQKIAEPTGPRVKFDRSAFDGSIIGLPATGPGERALAGGVRPEAKVEFSSEVVSGLRDFAVTYVDKLIDLQKTPITVGGTTTTVYEVMKNQQAGIDLNYQEDEAMLAAFSKIENGQRVIKSADEVNAMILEHPLMMQNLMAVAERYARDSLAALGVRAEMARPGTRTNTDRLRRTVDLPIDQGRLRESYNRLDEWARRPEEQGGRAGDRSNISAITRGLGPWSAAGGLLGAIGGTFVGGPVGLVEGAVAGSSAFSAIATGVGRLTREGPRLVLTDDQDVLAQAQRPGEQLRSKYLIGVDPAHPELSVRGGEKVEAEAVRLIYLRAMYMTDLGVPPQRLDALSDQFLNSLGQRPEEIDNKMTADVQRRFEELGGRAPGIAIDAARDIYRRAQEGALMDRFAQVMRENRPREDVGQLLTKAIDARQEGGTALQSRKKEATEEHQRLQQDKTAVGEAEPKIVSYREKVLTVQGSRESIREALSKIIQGGNTLGYEDALNALRASISVVGAPDITIPDENGIPITIHDLPGESERIKTLRQADINGIPPRGAGESEKTYNSRYDDARTIIFERYKPQLDEIDRQRRLVSEKINGLVSLQTTANNSGNEALSSAEVKTGTQELAEISEDYRRLLGLGLDDDDLATEDFYQILSDANSLFLLDPNFGWPENDNKEMRAIVRKGVIQARANVLERAGTPRANVVETNYQAAIVLGITNEQLRVLTVDELEKLPAAAHRRISRGALNNAQLWAREQLRYLEDSVRQETDNIQTAEGVQARRLRSIDMDAEIGQLTMIRDIYMGRDGVKTRAAQAYFLPEQRAGLEDVNPVTGGAGGYTAAEQASGLPRNVLEVLNILTNYQSAPDRNGAFQQIWRNLGSNADTILLPRLRNAFGTPGADIAAFANELHTIINTRATAASDFGRAAGENAVNEFVQWGLSIST